MEGRTAALNQLQVAWLERSCGDGRGCGQRVEHMLPQRRISEDYSRCKGALLRFWEDSFTLDILKPKEYKEGIISR